jgi:hypothetical protein
MATLEGYLEAFGKELRRYEPWQLEGTRLPKDAIEFLTTVGLPQDESPFLDFHVPSAQHVRVLAEQWGVAEPMKEHLRRFVHIGNGEGGDPVCLDPGADGAVVMLNHEARFVPYFLNTSVQQLAASLARCHQLYVEANANERAGTEPITAEMQTRLVHDLKAVDAPAMEEGRYWAGICEDIQDLY